MRIEIFVCDRKKERAVERKRLDCILKCLADNGIGPMQPQQGRAVTITGLVKVTKKPTR